jgi:7-keto-8-aminopelargonate synthetase-like enzyme
VCLNGHPALHRRKGLYFWKGIRLSWRVCGMFRHHQKIFNQFIYSTALSPHSVISIDCAFDFLKGQPTLQKDLTSKVQIFQSNIAPSAYSNKSNSSIQTIIIPGNDNVRKFSQALSTEGFDVRPILSPTVPKDKERLRICLHAFNHDVDIVALSKLINKNFEQFAGVSVAS